jgi:membrane protease subunit (stomatin/prohibitin family)
MQVDRFSMGVELDVFPPEGGDPYKVQYTFPTARMKAPLSVGMEVPVKVMPDDPMAVAVQWEALKGSIAASGGDMAVAMQGIQNTYAGTADAAGRAYLAEKEAADAAKAADDPAARLQKLTQLKDAGLINDDEFATKKQEILGDL